MIIIRTGNHMVYERGNKMNKLLKSIYENEIYREKDTQEMENVLKRKYTDC